MLTMVHVISASAGSIKAGCMYLLEEVERREIEELLENGGNSMSLHYIGDGASIKNRTFLKNQIIFDTP